MSEDALRYGYNRDWMPGDKVLYMGMPARVGTWEVESLGPWAVPIVIDEAWANHEGYVTIAHDAHLEERDWTTQEEERAEERDKRGYPPEYAKLGDPMLSGRWQSTGPYFEVMFYAADEPGVFYIREKDQREEAAP